MIVISGALVLVAAVLLVLGIVSSMTLVYAAIGLSIVSAVFLLVGVFQHPATAPAAQARNAEHPEKAPDAPRDAAADFPLEAADADDEAESAATGADVLVVSGRPRYHVGGCEYVEGQDDSEPLEITEARELGFTACGVCRPNETLASTAADAPAPAAITARIASS